MAITTGARSEFAQRYRDTLVGNLGVKLVGARGGVYTATLKVSASALNSQGLLHGGITALVAETLASFASLYPVRTTHRVLGVSMFVSHIDRGQRGDLLRFEAKPLRSRGSLHVWAISVTNDIGTLISNAQVTVSVRPREAEPAHPTEVRVKRFRSGGRTVRRR